jgi:hypothetical protein
VLFRMPWLKSMSIVAGKPWGEPQWDALRSALTDTRVNYHYVSGTFDKKPAATESPNSLSSKFWALVGRIADRI